MLVLETKTFSGEVFGHPDARTWEQRLRDGRRFEVVNPLRQNLAHVRAVERVVGDRRVWVRGYVVSAGSARLSPEIAHVPVPVAGLGAVLKEGVATSLLAQASIAAAWDRLRAEAARSDERREAQLAYIRSARA